MKYLKIQNKGELDKRILCLMGGTTKRGNDELIGNFGTGLKYSIAYLLRNKVDFKIFSGETEIKISTEKESITGVDFNVMTVDGEKTSISDSMGVDWRPWMIVRELYSNALDEGNAVYGITEDLNGELNTTTFYIELTPDFLEVYNSWNDYFIVGSIPFYENNRVAIHPQKGKLKVYKQGILIHTSKEDSLFNYDLKTADLNELREYKGYLRGDIRKVITSLNDTKIVEYLIENIKEEHFEATVDFDYSWEREFSPAWADVLKGCKIIHKDAKRNLEARGVKVDDTLIVLPENLYKGLSEKFPTFSALRVSEAVNDFYEIYNDRLHDKVKKAQDLLEDCGYFIDPELSFIYGIFGDKNVLARVDLDSKKIYISEKHLDTDLFSIMTMLVEENEHYKTGMRDETREFQQHFINLYTNSMVEKSKVDII